LIDAVIAASLTREVVGCGAEASVVVVVVTSVVPVELFTALTAVVGRRGDLLAGRRKRRLGLLAGLGKLLHRLVAGLRKLLRGLVAGLGDLLLRPVDGGIQLLADSAGRLLVVARALRAVASDKAERGGEGKGGEAGGNSVEVHGGHSFFIRGHRTSP
jgi:hypothetical protein